MLYWANIKKQIYGVVSELFFKTFKGRTSTVYAAYSMESQEE